MKRVLFALFGLLLSVPAFAAILPAGYTELQYIESTGTQYIDTNIIPIYTDILEMNMSISAGGRSFAGAAPAPTDNSSAANNSYRLLIANNSGYSNWGTGTGGSTTKTELGVTAGLDNYYVYNLSNTGVKIDDTQKVSWTSTALTIQDTLKIFTARSENTSYGVGRIKSVKLYDSNNTMKINLIPAQTVINNETVNGMYDTVSGHFYRSAVANTNFVAGPEACPNGGTLREYVSASGTGAQVGVPTPEHPVEPTFYHQGRMILRKVGDVADTYDASTGKITRRVGVKVLNGTEGWKNGQGQYATNCYADNVLPNVKAPTSGTDGSYAMCTAFSMVQGIGSFVEGTGWVSNNPAGRLNLWYGDTAENFKTYLAQQYAAGTPVTIWYPLAEPVEEDWPASQCESLTIKVATKDYVTGNHGFGPIATTLNTVIATIEGIVSSTVTQATSISTLATQKQTRPDDDYTDDNNAENCPDYKQCLLVEGTDGKPHWYPIDDPFRDFAAPIVGTNTAPTSTTNASGYTQLEYIESTGTQYIDTGIQVDSTNNTTVRLEIDGNFGTGTASNANGWTLDGSAYPNTHTYVGLNAAKKIAYGNDNDIITSYTETDLTGRHTYVIDYVAGKVLRDNVEITSFTARTSTKPAHNLFIFGWATTREFQVSAKKYGFKVYLAGTLVRDFVPVRRNSDGKYGMYDKAHNVFYPNTATSGADFTPGPEVLAQDPAIPGMSWTATWAGGNGVTAGTVNGEARCTSVAGSNDASSSTPTKFSQLTSANQTAWGVAFTSSTVSNYLQCWCKIDGVTPTSGNAISPMGATEWVFRSTGSSAADCANGCAYACADSVRIYSDFRKAVFGL